MLKRSVRGLSDIFKESEIYSQNRYNTNSPLRVFQREYPNHNYSIEIEEFLNNQKEAAFGDGADLPWWGELYFSEEKAARVMVLTQDSLGPNKGSVVAYMPFIIDNTKSPNVLNEFVRKYDWQKFGAYSRFRKLFNQLKMDTRFLYVTDARKIKGDWKTLLEQEIEIVSPDIILCLGQTGLEYLADIKGGVTSIVDKQDTTVQVLTNKLSKLNRKPIVVTSLFPSGSNGHYTVVREKNTVNTFNNTINYIDTLD